MIDVEDATDGRQAGEARQTRQPLVVEEIEDPADMAEIRQPGEVRQPIVAGDDQPLGGPAQARELELHDHGAIDGEGPADEHGVSVGRAKVGHTDASLRVLEGDVAGHDLGALAHRWHHDIVAEVDVVAEGLPTCEESADAGDHPPGDERGPTSDESRPARHAWPMKVTRRCVSVDNVFAEQPRERRPLCRVTSVLRYYQP